MPDVRAQTLSAIYQGEDVLIPFTGTDDPSAMTLAFVVGDDLTGGDPYFSTTSITKTGPTTGVWTLTVSLTSAETLLLDKGTFEFQLWDTTTNNTEVLAAGTVEVRTERRGERA